MCAPSGTQMELIESLRKVRIEHPPLPPYIDCEELLATEEPAPAVVDTPAAPNVSTTATWTPPIPAESTLTVSEELTSLPAEPAPLPEETPDKPARDDDAVL
ncbi:hypothetical protein SH661x_003713 [Planctomicrobium sp. SH661]|uniref:hypothetical protein n=1 Tax=Planctomicrobium sp. SH661 TaxID=3448124 RepID=UPI003F5B26C6